MWYFVHTEHNLLVCIYTSDCVHQFIELIVIHGAYLPRCLQLYTRMGWMPMCPKSYTSMVLCLIFARRTCIINIEYLWDLAMFLKGLWISWCIFKSSLSYSLFVIYISIELIRAYNLGTLVVVNVIYIIGPKLVFCYFLYAYKLDFFWYAYKFALKNMGHIQKLILT